MKVSLANLELELRWTIEKSPRLYSKDIDHYLVVRCGFLGLFNSRVAALYHDAEKSTWRCAFCDAKEFQSAVAGREHVEQGHIKPYLIKEKE